METPYQAASFDKRARILEALASLPYPRHYEPPHSEIPFGDLFSIWARFGMAELQKKGAGDFTLLSETAARQLEEKLVKDLSFRCAPAMAALLHLARLDKKLHGDSPKGNYLYFIENIFTDPAYQREAFAQFPLLARSAAATLLLWIDQAAEFLRRLHRDQRKIEALFFAGKSVGKIAHLSPSLSDPHQGNRAVYGIEFESGEKLIYKPKNLSLDAAYNQFLDHLGLGLKTYRILDKEAYGWVEFIETLPCHGEGELKRYFERLGMLICIMFVLDGTDCHYENVLASGEHPVLIDLESLFHPTLKQTRPLPDLDVWNRSVFRTGFLPSFGLAAQRRMDISPLSAEEEQELPRAVAQWQDVNTDRMQFAFVKKKVRISVPRPKYHGKTVSVTSFIPDLLRGFEAMYKRLMGQRDEILDRLEPLFRFPVRCIFRPTELYFQILQRLSDPKLMSSEEETENALGVLTRFSAINDSPDLETVARCEKEALLHGDIPFFLSSPSDSAIYLGKEKIAPSFFQGSSKERVVGKIFDLSESDLRLQLEYIDHSLYYLKMADSPKNYRYAPYDPEKAGPALSDGELLSYADRIGEKILSMAQPLSDGSLAWISLELDPKIDRFIFQPLSMNFYSGTAGIALFFGALGKYLQKPRYSKVSEELLAQIIRPYKEEKEAMRLLLSVGAMSGAGGAIYCFTALAKILRRPDYLKEALAILPLIENRKLDEGLDIITGSSGFLLSLLALYRQAPEKRVLDLAIAAGESLLKKGKRIGPGTAWETMENKFLCGFSHGAAGIAYSLLKLYEAVPEKKFLEAARQGFAYESALYSPAHENWPDFRLEDNFSSCGWCHGAPGIALSRLFALPLLPSGLDLERALQSTAKHLEANLDHLCCGNMGRTVVLWDAGKILKRDDLKEMAERQTGRILKRFAEQGCFRLFYDLPENIQSPGFMQGLAGIGYQLLRQTKAGEDLPEALVLE